MTIPAMSLTIPPPAMNPVAVLELPFESLFGVALPAIAVVALGVVAIALLRARRQARPAPVPSSAAA